MNSVQEFVLVQPQDANNKITVSQLPLSKFQADLDKFSSPNTQNQNQQIIQRIRGQTTMLLNERDSVDQEYQKNIVLIDNFREGQQLLESKLKVVANHININASYLCVVEMVTLNDVEKAYNYNDPYPLLGTRRQIIVFIARISALCYMIIKHPLFEIASLLIILGNSVMLIASDPNSQDDPFILQMEEIFLILYTIEMGLKMFAMGFILNKNAYLRDAWNVLDFVIVSTAYLPYILNSKTIDLKSLRFMRILRPLRTITSIKALKVIMLALLSAMPMLCDTFVVVLFIFLIFGIGGLQLFQGLLKNQCFAQEYGFPHHNYLLCGNYRCPEDYICGKMLENPNYGVTNFDNILYSFLQVFIINTLEGWTEIATFVIKTFTEFTIIYFVILVFLGSFFLINIILAVIKAKFSDTQNKQDEEDSNNILNLGLEDANAKQLVLWNTNCANKNVKVKNMEFYFPLRELGLEEKFRKHFHIQKMSRTLGSINTSSHGNSKVHQEIQYKDIDQKKSNLEQPNNISSALNNSKEILLNQSIQQPFEYVNVGSAYKSIQNDRRTSPRSKKLYTNQNDSRKVRFSAQLKLIKPISNFPKFSPKQHQDISIPDDPSELNLNHVDGDIFQFPPNGQSEQVEERGYSNQISLASSPSKSQSGQVSRKQSMSQTGQKSKRDSSPYSGQISKRSNLLLYLAAQQINGSPRINSGINDIYQQTTKDRANEVQRSIVTHTTVDADLINDIDQEYVEAKQSLLQQTQLSQVKIIVLSDQLPEDLISTSVADILVLTQKKRQQTLRMDYLHQIKIKSYHFIYPQFMLSTQRQQQSNKDISITNGNPNIDLKSVRSANTAIGQQQQDRSITIQQMKKDRIPIRQNRRLTKQVNQKEIKQSESQFEQEELLEIIQQEKAKSVKLLQLQQEKLRIKALTLNEISKMINQLPDEEEDQIQFTQFQIIYQQLMETEFQTGVRINLIWSGYEVMRPQCYSVLRTNKVTHALQNQDVTVWIVGLFGMWLVFRNGVQAKTQQKWFENFIIFTVILNTTSLSVQSFQVVDDNVFTILNYCFTVIFTSEMLMKLIGSGFKGYVQDRLNMLDGTIVLISLAEIFFLSGNSAASAFKTFRTFRVLRVTKLFKALDFMKVIIKVVAKSISSFVYIALLLFLFIFIYALLGRQLYSGKLSFEHNDLLRSNFDDFPQAMITVFQILTLENWNSILYYAIRSDSGPYITAIYFLSWIFIGNYILLNLFLAILLDGFTSDDLMKDDEQPETQMSYPEIDYSDTYFLEIEKISGNKDFHLTKKEKNQKIKGQANYKAQSNQGSQMLQVHQQPITDKMAERRLSIFSLNLAQVQLEENKDEIEDIEQSVEQQKLKRENLREKQYGKMLCEESLWLFQKSNPIRKLCFRIITYEHFESVILLLIVLSSLKLVFDTYLPEQANNNSDQLLLDVSNSIDILFNTCFTIELTLKVITHGLIVEEDTYLRDFWNILDSFIVVSSLIDMSVSSIDLAAVKILRLLRTLRPLRFVSHNINMKIVVNALLQSVGSIFNVLVVVCLIWLMFAILGTALFNDRMGYCNTKNYFSIPQSQCQNNWAIQRNNFQHVGNSSLTLFVISTLEGWPDYLYQAIDSDFPQYGPKLNGNQAYAIFYIAFILIGSLFLLNLFVGALCYNFDKAQKNEKAYGYIFMSPDQARWIEMHKLLVNAEPEVVGNWVPQTGFRLKLYELAMSTKFEVFIMTVILLNVILMALDYEGSTQSYQDVLQNFNYVFTSIFTFEMLLKMCAMTLSGYFSTNWNRFDCFIVSASILDILLANVAGNTLQILSFGPQLIRIIRVFRITRILRLVKQLKGLQKLIETIIISLPSLFNVGALLVLVMFIYSILACFLFKKVTTGEKINENYNFLNFSRSYLTLFRCLTGEDWPMFMYDLMRTDTSCIPGQTCGSLIAIPFFITYTIISTFIMLNLFILIVLQDFEEYNLKKDNPLEEYKERLEQFKQIWSLYTDKEFGVRLHKKYLKQILIKLQPPLGIGSNDEFHLAKKMVSLDLKHDDNNCLYFNDVFYELMKGSYKSAFQNTEHGGILRGLVMSEIATKKKLFKKKQQDYERLLQKKNIQSSKLNPFFLIIFTRTAFLSWRSFSLQSQEFIINKGGQCRTPIEKLQLVKEFLNEDTSERSQGSDQESQIKEQDEDDEDENSKSQSETGEDNREEKKQDMYSPTIIVSSMKTEVAPFYFGSQPDNLKTILQKSALNEEGNNVGVRLNAEGSYSSMISIDSSTKKSQRMEPQELQVPGIVDFQHVQFNQVRNNLIQKMNFVERQKPEPTSNEGKGTNTNFDQRNYKQSVEKRKKLKFKQIDRAYK